MCRKTIKKRNSTGQQTVVASTRAGYRLLHEGTDALADVECNGIRIDVDYCEDKLMEVKEARQQLRDELLNCELGQAWKRQYSTPNLESNAQLGQVLYNGLGLTPKKQTKGGEKGSTDYEALLALVDDVPDLNRVLRWRKLKKGIDFLEQFLKEQVGGFLYPFYNLHNVASYRGSCNSINFQQLPSRDEELMKMIRTAIIPVTGMFLAEFDYKSLEVNVGCPYHRDENMIAYVSGAGDMHQDKTMELLTIPQQLSTSSLRKNIGKNGFVFPEFYGSRWFKTAPTIWERTENEKLADGTPVRTYLRRQGIKELGTARRTKFGWQCSPGSFYEHVRQIEDVLWNETFPGYRDWRENIWREYQSCGSFDLLSGFRCQGLFDRNQVINYPIQGTAFHILLKSLILLNDKLKREGWNSYIIGQIHDSIVMYVDPVEWQALCAMVLDIISNQIPAHWPWINVPLTVEVERAGVNKEWSKMREVQI